ncbi:hypothetical protein NU118_003932 [Salmonella enterica]|nr:hypothetical protein [Salmonella enterica]
MTDLRQIVFSQTGHFHDGIAVDTVLQHGTGKNVASWGVGVLLFFFISPGSEK